jgi:hypothetical protein
MLGQGVYGQAELLSILGQPVQGNGLVSLSRQLIATKLNIANGANPTEIADAVSEADALIGSLVVPPVGDDFIAPSSTGALIGQLDDYNSGITGPGHCANAQPEACCFPDGSCQDLLVDDCVAEGGVPQGPGTICDTAVCNPNATQSKTWGAIKELYR